MKSVDLPTIRQPLFTPSQAVLLVILLGSIGRIIAGAVMGLGFGEGYYFAVARHLELSYFDQPPLSLWISWLTMQLTGQVTPLALRMPFIALFVGTCWFMFQLTRRFFGEWPGFYAVLLLNLSAVFTLPVGSWLQPDGPLMFFWLACAWCLSLLLFPQPAAKADIPFSVGYRDWLLWILAGILLGLAMLSKYHAAFLALAAGWFMLLNAPLRRWLLHPAPYLAALLALAIFSPVLIWNAQNDWISFLWQSERGIESRGLRLDWFFRSLGGQALWLMPWIWWPLVEELWRCIARYQTEPLLPRELAPETNATLLARRFLFWTAVGPIIFFTVVAAWAPLGFHFHWQAPGYLMLFAALGWTVHQRLSRPGFRRPLTRWWLFASVILTLLFSTFLVSHTATGWWREVGPTWLNSKVGEGDDPTLEALPYVPLEQALRQRGLLRDDLFYFTNRWFQAGKIDHALKGRCTVLCFHNDSRSLAFVTDSTPWIGKDGVLIGTKKFLTGDAHASDEHLLAAVREQFGSFFRKIEPQGHVAIMRGSVEEETLYLFYATHLKKSYTNPYRRHLEINRSINQANP